MANDFSGEGNLQGHWRFESGAFTTDSSGNGNTLTDNNTVQADAVNYMEGAQSAYFSDANGEFFSRTDANLNADFPLKSGGGTDIIVCFWIRTTADSKSVWSKISTGTAKGGIYSFFSTKKLYFRLYDSSLGFDDLF